jgi:hypothetical protein
MSTTAYTPAEARRSVREGTGIGKPPEDEAEVELIGRHPQPASY